MWRLAKKHLFGFDSRSKQFVWLVSMQWTKQNSTFPVPKWSKSVPEFNSRLSRHDTRPNGLVFDWLWPPSYLETIQFLVWKSYGHLISRPEIELFDHLFPGFVKAFIQMVRVLKYPDFGCSLYLYVHIFTTRTDLAPNQFVY